MKAKNKNKTKKRRRARRVFTPTFRADVVKLCEAEGETVSGVCERLDLTQSSVRGWIRKAQSLAASESGTSSLTIGEQEELRALRRQVKTLKMEREILKKAAAFVCHDGAR